MLHSYNIISVVRLEVVTMIHALVLALLLAWSSLEGALPRTFASAHVLTFLSVFCTAAYLLPALHRHAAPSVVRPLLWWLIPLALLAVVTNILYAVLVFWPAAWNPEGALAIHLRLRCTAGSALWHCTLSAILFVTSTALTLLSLWQHIYLLRHSATYRSV